MRDTTTGNTRPSPTAPWSKSPKPNAAAWLACVLIASCQSPQSVNHRKQASFTSSDPTVEGAFLCLVRATQQAAALRQAYDGQKISAFLAQAQEDQNFSLEVDSTGNLLSLKDQIRTDMELSVGDVEERSVGDNIQRWFDNFKDYVNSYLYTEEEVPDYDPAPDEVDDYSVIKFDPNRIGIPDLNLDGNKTAAENLKEIQRWFDSDLKAAGEPPQLINRLHLFGPSSPPAWVADDFRSQLDKFRDDCGWLFEAENEQNLVEVMGMHWASELDDRRQSAQTILDEGSKDPGAVVQSLEEDREAIIEALKSGDIHGAAQQRREQQNFDDKEPSTPPSPHWSLLQIIDNVLCDGDPNLPGLVAQSSLDTDSDAIDRASKSHETCLKLAVAPTFLSCVQKKVLSNKAIKQRAATEGENVDTESSNQVEKLLWNKSASVVDDIETCFETAANESRGRR